MHTHINATRLHTYSCCLLQPVHALNVNARTSQRPAIAGHHQLRAKQFTLGC
jgi:hypothetical protein